MTNGDELIVPPDVVYITYVRTTPQKVWDALASTGLDTERARRDMERPEIAARLQQDTADIVALNVRQTPTFFINGKRQVGAITVDELDKLLAPLIKP